MYAENRTVFWCTSYYYGYLQWRREAEASRASGWKWLCPGGRSGRKLIESTHKIKRRATVKPQSDARHHSINVMTVLSTVTVVV